jgi:hypothetical protein
MGAHLSFNLAGLSNPLFRQVATSRYSKAGYQVQKSEAADPCLHVDHKLKAQARPGYIPGNIIGRNA